jgi:hypothetical protein
VDEDVDGDGRGTEEREKACELVSQALDNTRYWIDSGIPESIR